LGITWAISVQLNYNDPFLPYTAYIIYNTPGTNYASHTTRCPPYAIILSPQGNTTVGSINKRVDSDYAYTPSNFPANSPAFQSGFWYLIPVLVNGVAYMIMWGTYTNTAQPTVNGIMIGVSISFGGSLTIGGISVISQTPYQAPMPSNLEGVFGVVMLEAET